MTQNDFWSIATQQLQSALRNHVPVTDRELPDAIAVITDSEVTELLIPSIYCTEKKPTTLRGNHQERRS